MSAVLLAIALAAAPRPATPSVPVGPWAVRQQKNLCILERPYKLGQDEITLAFQQSFDTSEMPVFVIVARQKGIPYNGTFAASILPNPASFKGRYVSVVVPETHDRVTRLTGHPEMLGKLKDGDVLRILAKPIHHDFPISKAGEAKIALQTCVADMKTAWGIDPNVAARIANPPRIVGDPARFLGLDAYPAEALRQRVEGRVVSLLDIDTAGAVANCRIVLSENPALDEGTCIAAKRVEFRPALDKFGQPLNSTYVLPVRWTMPGTAF